MIFYEFFLKLLIIFFLPLASLFNKKLKIILNEQKQIFSKLKTIQNNENTIWFHVASAGEFLQALPLIKVFKENNFYIFLTFTSSSTVSFINKYPVCNTVSYFPFDTKKNIKKLISIIEPKKLILVKYELWPNLLCETYKAKIPSFLISASISNKRFGFLFKNLFLKFKTIFSINEHETKAFQKIGIKNVITTGDSKIDYVKNRIFENLDAKLHTNLSNIKNNYDKILILGSSWPKDEKLVLKVWLKLSQKIFLIIAPHEPAPAHLEKLKKEISVLGLNFVLLSELKDTDFTKINVLIVDKIGILANLYKIADYAFVGTGRGGVHNILEPAVYLLPTMFRENYRNSSEAIYFVEQNLAKIINNSDDLFKFINLNLKDPDFLKVLKEKIKNYFDSNSNISKIIFDKIISS